MRRLIFMCRYLTVFKLLCLFGVSWAYAESNSTLSTVDFESYQINQAASDIGWIKRYGNGTPDSWTVTSPTSTGNSSTRVLNIGGADVQIISPLIHDQTIKSSYQNITLSCQVQGKQSSGVARHLKLCLASKNLDAVTPYFGFTIDSSGSGTPNDILRFSIGNTLSTDDVLFDHWYELKLLITVNPDNPQASIASLYYRDITANQADFTLATGLDNLTINLSSQSLPQHWGYWQIRGSYAGQIDALSITLTPLAKISFETAQLNQTATELNWTKRYGNGSPDSWKVSTPSGTGYPGSQVLNVGGADVQIISPLQLTVTISSDDRKMYIRGLFRGSMASGVSQHLKLCIASESLNAVTPYFGFLPTSSVSGGSNDLLRFTVGSEVSTDSIAIDHWYELLLVINSNTLEPHTSYASLFYRDLTASQTNFTLATGLGGVTLAMNINSLPQDWGYWQLRGSYAGQIGDLILGFGTPTELCSGLVQMPIIHEDDWLSERDLYGYNPDFIPNTISFDMNNRPYIRQGFRHWDGAQTIERHPVAIQTLDQTDYWEKLDFTDVIYDQYSWWDGTMATGSFANERIAFDTQGGLYTIVDAQTSNLGKLFLIYKPQDAAYQLYELPTNRWTMIESQDGHNTLNNPPAILCSDKSNGSLYLIQPNIQTDGTLSLGNPVFITANSLLVPQHSGAANCAITVNDMTYIVWASSIADSNHPGTMQYIASYNHQTGIVSAPVYLGATGQGTTPDNHNIPGVTIDSNGILHVVLGAHHDQFLYTHSLQSHDISNWSANQALGVPWDQVTGSYSYVSLLCDANDNLHVAARWAGDYYYFRLVYLRKTAGQDWEDHKVLMVPFRNMYSCWYHKLSMDRNGKLFLNYIYYANQLSDQQILTYEAKWPEDNLVDPDPNTPSSWLSGVTPHDPGMLVSDDGGDTWHLTTTTDLLP